MGRDRENEGSFEKEGRKTEWERILTRGEEIKAEMA